MAGKSKIVSGFFVKLRWQGIESVLVLLEVLAVHSFRNKLIVLFSISYSTVQLHSKNKNKASNLNPH